MINNLEEELIKKLISLIGLKLILVINLLYICKRLSNLKVYSFIILDTFVVESDKFLKKIDRLIQEK